MPDLLANITAILRADFQAEAEAGFPALKRMPSTDAIKFLDYFESLELEERGRLLDARAKLGAMQFFPPPQIQQLALDLIAADAALLRYRTVTESGPFAYGLRYVNLRMARAALNDPVSMTHMARTRSQLDFVPRDDPARELTSETDIRKIQTAKAPLLRKLLDKSLARLFLPEKSKLPGGEIRYSGSIGATDLTISIQFSALYAQLYWSIYKMTMANPALKAFRLQDFWGGAGWDYLTEENASRSIALLCERIVYLVKLKERVDEA